jgi:hypothetical protein
LVSQKSTRVKLLLIKLQSQELESEAHIKEIEQQKYEMQKTIDEMQAELSQTKKENM